jgi:hypothetical protein
MYLIIKKIPSFSNLKDCRESNCLKREKRMGGSPSQMLAGSGFYTTLYTDSSGFFNQEYCRPGPAIVVQRVETLFYSDTNVLITARHGLTNYKENKQNVVT